MPYSKSDPARSRAHHDHPTALQQHLQIGTDHGNDASSLEVR
jgi:hypothetical protein